MAYNTRLTSGNLNLAITGAIDDLLLEYPVDLLKDVRKQTQLKSRLGDILPGNWTVSISGGSIRMNVVTGNNSKLQFVF